MTDINLGHPTVEGEMTFAVGKGGKPATFPTELDPNTGIARTTGLYETRNVSILNGRSVRDDLDLDDQGFILVDHASSVSDFYDEDTVQDRYYSECTALVKKLTGVEKVAIFDHTIRIENADKRNSGEIYRAPVRSVHNDYTDWSAPKRVRDILPADEAEERLTRRYIMVNVWRPLMEPVQSWPLVLCDAKSIGPKDMIAADHIYPDRRGETYRTAYSASQQWYYFPEMTMKEAVILKCFDSETDGRARYSAHGAADLAGEPPSGYTPRESIEVRIIGFYGD